jgi:adenylate cyclase
VAQEIERKFLRDTKRLSEFLSSSRVSYAIAQGYLCEGEQQVVRVRLKGQQAFLTIKIAQTELTRVEFEYPIPVVDAQILLHSCAAGLVEKRRYEIDFYGKTLEVDVFEGLNKGLVIAEVELTHEKEQIVLPDWIKEEVTYDARYLNSNLAKNPYLKW